MTDKDLKDAALAFWSDNLAKFGGKFHDEYEIIFRAGVRFHAEKDLTSWTRRIEENAEKAFGISEEGKLRIACLEHAIGIALGTMKRVEDSLDKLAAHPCDASVYHIKDDDFDVWFDRDLLFLARKEINELIADK